MKIARNELISFLYKEIASSEEMMKIATNRLDDNDYQYFSGNKGAFEYILKKIMSLKDGLNTMEGDDE